MDENDGGMWILEKPSASFYHLSDQVLDLIAQHELTLIVTLCDCNFFFTTNLIFLLYTTADDNEAIV